jgi:hypothetical protein
MVTSGTVSVTVTVAGQPLPRSASITVNPRSWTTSPATATQSTNGTLDKNGVAVVLPLPPTPTGNDSGLGFYEARINRAGFNNNVVTGDAPNAGYIFYNDALVFTIFDSRYELNPDLENSASTFSVKNCGQSGYISWANLLAQTKRHEYNSSTQSHHGEYVLALASNNPGTYFESRVGAPGSDENAFNNATSAGLNSQLSNIVNAIAVEPFPVNVSETNQSLGNINYTPYGACP